MSKYTTGKTKLSQPLTYKLVSMITHLGASQHSGHYTAIGLTDNHGYYEFDDSSVRPISHQNVLNTNAYVILYEMENTNSSYTSSPNCTATSSSVHEKIRNGHFSGSSSSSSTMSPSSYAVASTSNSQSTVTSYNNDDSKKSSGFIGPILPPHMQQNSDSNNNNIKNSSDHNSKSPLKSLSNNNSEKNNQKAFSNSQHLISGSKLVTNGVSNNSNKSGVNLNSGSKRPATQTLNDKSSEAPPEKKSHIILPSMPKLLEEQQQQNSSISNQNGSVSTLKQSGQQQSSNSNKKPTTNGHHHNNTSSTSSSNYISSSSSYQTNKQIKSLVPYDSNDDSDDKDTVALSDKKSSNGSLILRKSIDLTATPSTSTSSSSSPISDGVKTPTVIKSKTGIWQVSDATKTPPLSPNSKGKSSSNIFNNYNTATPTKNSQNYNRYHQQHSNKYNGSVKKLFNNNNENRNSNGHGNTVNQLLNMSHQGYGSNVSSWSGGKSIIEKEVS